MRLLLTSALTGLLLTATIACEVSLDAHDAIDEATAVNTATKWMTLHYPERADFTVSAVRAIRQHEIVTAYAIELEEGGFVITSARRDANPIIAYSNTDSLRGEDSDQDTSVTRFISKLADVTDTATDAETYDQLWTDIENASADDRPMFHSDEDVMEPMTETRWSQSGGTYNKYTPVVNEATGARAPTGCASVALGQMLRHYNYPKRGLSYNRYCSSGKSIYNCWDGEIIEVNFNTNYGWNNMPTSLNRLSAEPEIDAVATLLFHVGVALEVKYGERGSNAQIENPTVFRSFKKHFRLSGVEMVDRDDYSDDEWTQLIRNEILHQRPVVLSGYDSRIDAGHAYILDGLDSDGYVHVNLGWGGSLNGYFDLKTLVIQHSVGSLSFTEDLIAFINFTPKTVPEGDRCNGPEGARCQVGLVCALDGDIRNVVDETASDAYGTCLDETSTPPDDDPPVEPETLTESFDDSVKQAEWRHFGPFQSVVGLDATMSGTGDADLYVKQGSRPTSSEYDCRPYKGSSNESCSLDGAGDYYVSVNGYAELSDFSLTVSYQQ